MAKSYRGEPAWQTQRLASHNSSGILLGAGAARAAAELGRKHNGQIPDTAIEDVTERFGQWLRSACEAARPARETASEDC